MNQLVYSSTGYLKLYPTDEMRYAATVSAINRAASIGFFSIKDVWRELGLACSTSNNMVAREKFYSHSYIQKVMKEVGIQSLKLNSLTSNTRRYYMPCVIETKEICLC